MNILLFAFETETNVLGQLALRLKAQGHRVLIASCDHYTVTHMRGEIAASLSAMGLAPGEYANLAPVFEELNRHPEDLGEDQVDWEFLRRIEREFCPRFSLLELLALDPLHTAAFHNRNIYYRPKNKTILFKSLEVHLKWLLGKFETFRPDAVLTANFQYLVKAAAFNFAQAMRVPYLMAGTCRIEDLNLVYDNFGLGTPQFVTEEMRRIAERGESCEQAEKYIARLQSELRPAYFSFEEALRTFRQRLSMMDRIVEIRRHIFPGIPYAMKVNRHFRGWRRPSYFLPTQLRILKMLVVAAWRRFRYFREPELNRRELPEGPFIYFPLHLLPENSVLTLSRVHNEYDCIFQLAKLLPVGWKVVVKVNPGMLISMDTHPTSHFLRISRLPNVQFISPLVLSGSIIQKAAGVACITGTALLEAAMFGKPGIRWGNTEFEAVSTIRRFSPEIARSHLGEAPPNNVKHYVQACFNLGFRMEENTFRQPPDDSPYYRQQVDAMMAAFLRRLEACREKAPLARTTG